MSALSFPVVCGVVLVLFSPVLPSVTPEFHIELPYGESKQSLLYETVPYSAHANRLKRQIEIPTGDEAAPDKGLLIKNPATVTVTNVKKPIIDPKALLPTAAPIDPSAAIAGQSLPTLLQQGVVDSSAVSGNIAPSTDESHADDPDQNFSDEDSFHFDGNSSYPIVPIFVNNTYYEKQDNYTLKKVDNYKYYDVHYSADGLTRHWIDMDNHPKAKKHDMLSNAHRRAATVKPSFNVSFYGHDVQNLTIATGGFIYVGYQVHAWLAATQYIAPLMANFDSSTSPNATVKYVNDDDLFAVEWNQVRLQDNPTTGPFTFQAAIFKNGTIVFVYKQVPIPVINITDSHHPVKVGLSDAYSKEKNLLFVRQKTIYEYDRIDLKQHSEAPIENGTVIIFTPLPTCVEIKTCEECVKAETTFKCVWCPAANRCSNGTDRYHQIWTQNGCDKPSGNLTTVDQCAASKSASSTSYNTAGDNSHIDDISNDIHGTDKSSADSYIKKIKAPESEGMSAAGVIGVMFLMMLIFGAVGWISYAYFFPHSPSGQLLIRYRPSQWAFRRGEARYTAASIHM